MLKVFLFLSSLAVNSSLFNRTTVPSADGQFYSSAEMVSALCQVFQVCQCCAFLLGRANRWGTDRLKKTLMLTVPYCPWHWKCDTAPFGVLPWSSKDFL